MPYQQQASNLRNTSTSEKHVLNTIESRFLPPPPSREIFLTPFFSDLPVTRTKSRFLWICLSMSNTAILSSIFRIIFVYLGGSTNRVSSVDWGLAVVLSIFLFLLLCKPIRARKDSSTARKKIKRSDKTISTFVLEQFFTQIIGLKHSQYFLNQTVNQNQSWLARAHFPALRVSFMYVLRVLIGLQDCPCPLWLARVITLFWFNWKLLY